MTRSVFHALLLISVATLGACSKEDVIQHSSAMEPTIPAGAMLTVDKSAYNSSKPLQWDIIVFKPMIGEGVWCSRVVGLPGDVVDFSGTTFTLNGKPLAPQPRFTPPSYQPPSPGESSITFPYTVPAKHYFVMGDNVSQARDSRYWGGLEGKKIIGKVVSKSGGL